MTTMQRQRDAEKVAKGRAILAKFYQVLKDDATNMDDLVGACIVVAPLLAFVITRNPPWRSSGAAGDCQHNSGGRLRIARH